MSAFRFDTVTQGDMPIHVASAGDPAAPLLLCLHGFPEYWAAWADVMPFLADRFHCVAPDLRGFNLSGKPGNLADYHMRHLLADVDVLADQFSPGRPLLLAGHDWGAALAYAYAFKNPGRLSGLVIANGVHPWCFQNAILNDPGQRAASQYINRLRLPEADRFMAVDGFARTLNMMTGFSSADWMTAEKRAGYIDAWSQPGAMHAMLNWYRASPIVVPGPDEAVATAPVLEADPASMTLNMPHLVIWGEDDQALRPACLAGLDRFAADLEIIRMSGAGHWILHEQPGKVAGAIIEFAGMS